ncbi:MAG: undecaprenyl-diphosphate phosphatase [Endomicrobiales bacterium]|nr:undecaprenyl-diphosphate phosphatase [Endomicrobiales bacterium]
MAETLTTAILGFVQGLTEFLPVSSSAHLVFFQHFLGWNKPELFFDIMLHLATVIAVLIYFRKDIPALFTTDKKTLYLLILASVPTAVIGFAGKDYFEQTFSSVSSVAVFLFFTGIILFTAQFFGKEKKAFNSFGIGDALLIGIAQGLAIMPGISRSGSTIAVAMLLGYKRSDSARFSFLLSVPAVLGAALLGFKDFSGDIGVSYSSVAVGMLVAVIAGLFAIHYLIKLLNNNKLYIFGFYCLVVSVLVFLFAK